MISFLLQCLFCATIYIGLNLAIYEKKLQRAAAGVAITVLETLALIIKRWLQCDSVAAALGDTAVVVVILAVMTVWSPLRRYKHHKKGH